MEEEPLLCTTWFLEVNPGKDLIVREWMNENKPKHNNSNNT